METTATVTEVRPYFIVKGADELIAFLQQTFDAELILRAPAPGGTVMHAEVRVGDSHLEIGDAGEQWTPIAAPMHVYLDNVDEAYRRGGAVALSGGLSRIGRIGRIGPIGHIGPIGPMGPMRPMRPIRPIRELSEAHGRWGPTRGAFHLFVSDCDAVYAEALRAGATSLWAPEDKPYGERSGGVTDPWGNQWYIATRIAG